jgi:16S rRNA (guanine527-N7)-methyltransferase
MHIPYDNFIGKILRQATKKLGIQLTEIQLTQLKNYLGLMQKWNQTYNLTGITNIQDLVYLHIVDSLSVVPYIDVTNGYKRILDVGSGAGLPGVVLAICLPDIQVCCVDKVIKKIAFIRQVGSVIGIPNLEAKHQRIEYMPKWTSDIIISRAFASLETFFLFSKKHLSHHGIWIAMKTDTLADEYKKIPSDIQLFHVEPLHLPNISAKRCLVFAKKPDNKSLVF